MSPRRTYDAAAKELERLRGDLVEEHPGRTSGEELSQWADDPVAWDLTAGRDPVDFQRDVMESVARTKRTAWRGCHACGKDFTIGSLAVWGAYARGMLVLVVSATERQVIGQTMREVRKAWRAARRTHGIGGQLFQGSVRIGGEDRIVALTGSANVDALTGWHEATSGVLVLISEGQGERLEEAAYDAAEGNVTTAKGRILAAGNPVRQGGRFHRIHQRATWNRFRTSAFDTPNVKAGETVRAGFPAPGWPKDVAQEYGESSPFYIGRVLAEFPDQVESALYRREWLEEAADHHEDGSLERAARRSQPVCGVDVARHGPDDSVMVVRQGPVVRGIEVWKGRLGTMDLAALIYDAADGYDVLPERGYQGLGPEKGAARGHLVVDEIGVGGGVLDRLEMMGFSTSGFIPQTSARNGSRFADRRAELAWGLRKRLEEGKVALPRDETLFQELLALQWGPTSSGTVRLESKEATKKRLGRSPDRADALFMSFAASGSEAFAIV